MGKKDLIVDEQLLWSIVNDGINIYCRDVLIKKGLLNDEYIDDCSNEYRKAQDEVVCRVVHMWFSGEEEKG